MTGTLASSTVPVAFPEVNCTATSAFSVYGMRELAPWWVLPALLGAAVATTPLPPLRIMPMGDSITQFECGTNTSQPLSLWMRVLFWRQDYFNNPELFADRNRSKCHPLGELPNPSVRSTLFFDYPGFNSGRKQPLPPMMTDQLRRPSQCAKGQSCQSCQHDPKRVEAAASKQRLSARPAAHTVQGMQGGRGAESS